MVEVLSKGCYLVGLGVVLVLEGADQLIEYYRA